MATALRGFWLQGTVFVLRPGISHATMLYLQGVAIMILPLLVCNSAAQTDIHVPSPPSAP